MSVSNVLEKIFRFLNFKIYDDELPVPEFVLIKKNVLTKWNLQLSNERKYIIKIYNKCMEDEIEKIVCDMLHCMSHEYCLLHGILDTSRDGRYHNKKFAYIANQHGLIAKRAEKNVSLVGYVTEEISDEVKIMIADQGKQWKKDIENAVLKSDEFIEPSSLHSVEYRCPICKKSIFAEENTPVYCGRCMVSMIPLKH